MNFAKLQSPADAADVSDDFPSDLDIDVQTPDGVVVELQLHKSAMTDDVPVLLMRNGKILRIPLPSTDVSIYQMVDIHKREEFQYYCFVSFVSEALRS